MSSTAAERSRAAHAAGELSHRQVVTIIIGLMMGMFLASLDQNVVGTAIKTIADDLHGYDMQAWVTTAYLITSTITTPLYGKLSDLYGRKKFFLAAIVIFVLGSLLCTFANDMTQLSIYRAVQGLGAGGLFSLSMAIIGDVVPPRERARYQGYFLAVFATSSVLGPVLGGFFADAGSILGIAGWRWVFLINVPLGIAAAIVVMITLHLHHERREARVDWLGAAAMVVALVPLLTVAEQGRSWGWTSGRSLLCYGIGIAGAIAFVAVEAWMKDDALIPLRIFRSRTIAIAISGGFVVGAGMFGGMTMIPQYLQVVKGASPTGSGFMMLPMVLGLMIAAVVSGQLMSKTGRIKVFPIFGISLMVVALLALFNIGADTALWLVYIEIFVFGFGLGNTMQPLTLAVQNAVGPREIGMATSAATFFRQIGGTLGVAIFLSVLFDRLPAKMASALTDAAKTPEFLAALRNKEILSNPVNAQFAKAITSHDSSFLGGILSDTSTLNHLAPVFAHPIKQGFSEAMSLVFLIGAVVCAIGAIIMCFMPNVLLAGRAPGEAPVAEHTVTDDLVDITAAEAGGHTIKELEGRDEDIVEPRRG